MKIALINGSPKVRTGASGCLLEDLKEIFPAEARFTEICLNKSAFPEGVLYELQDSDAWIFAFPLYVDGIPGHLLSDLMMLEQSDIKKEQKRVYGLVNCGFYEGIQAETALEILRNWCEKTGCIWGGGIGIGGGGCLSMDRESGLVKWMKGPVTKKLEQLAAVIWEKKVQENEYVSVALPKVIYQAAAHRGWKQKIKRNGGKPEDLMRKL